MELDKVNVDLGRQFIVFVHLFISIELNHQATKVPLISVLLLMLPLFVFGSKTLQVL